MGEEAPSVKPHWEVVLIIQALDPGRLWELEQKKLHTMWE
jgi:hypothetical protein